MSLKLGNNEILGGFPVLLRNISGPFTRRAPHADPVNHGPQAFKKGVRAQLESPVVPGFVDSRLLAGGLWRNVR